MCLIVASEDGRVIDLEDLKIAYDNNPDGAGIMWLQDGRVHQLHTLPKSFSEVKDLALHAAGFPHAMHLRYCTRGEVTTDNCHPFTVLNMDDGDDNDLVLMHNGTFSWINITDEDKKNGHSDTSVFAARLQRNFRAAKQENDPEVSFDKFFTPSFIDKFSIRVSKWNKVAFLANDGRWSYLNPSEWSNRNGMMYSNVYSLQPGYRDKQLNHHGFSSSSFQKKYDWTSKHNVKIVKDEEDSTTFRFSHVEKDSNHSKNESFHFSRSSFAKNENIVYLVRTSSNTTTYNMVDINTMKLSNGKRLGKAERKALKKFLAKETNKTELHRKETHDNNGRRIMTVQERSPADDQKINQLLANARSN